MTPSSSCTCRLAGMKPAPMPWIGCGLGLPPEITGDSVSILAERAYVDGPNNHAEVLSLLEEARAKAAGAPPEHRDIAELLVADLVELASNMASDRNLAHGGAPAPA